jgi:class 3 adenylate cyclase/tetratricopeptide (TPR) repeat protein
MAAHEGEASARAPARTPFVGREAELDWLLERVRQAARGRPRACLVRGEPGIGKSRLLAELGRQALAEGLHVWSLRGSPDVQTPYLALDALVQDLVARCLCGPALREASARWWKHLERDRSEEPGVLATAPFGPPQRALSLAFQRAVLERAAHGGFLLLIDDFQWLDGSSLGLVADAVTAAGEAASDGAVGLVVVMASRGAASGSAAESVERSLELELICDALTLRGLGDRETEEMLRGLGIDPPTRALATRLREAAQGNPERLERVVRELQRRGALELRGRSYIATLDPLEVEGEKSSRLDLPQDDPLRRTLQGLGLFVAAVGGEGLAAVLDVPREEVEAQLADAEVRGWLRRADGSVSFEDPALGRALAAEIPDAERRVLHHRIARWLVERGAEPPELLAHHWQRAWPDAPSASVVEALRNAAQQAMRARDWRRAAFHYERALRVAGASGVSAATQAELHYRAGLAHFRSLDGEPSRTHFERAAEGYERAGDRVGRVRALVERMRTIVSLSGSAYGNHPPDLPELEQLIEGLDDEECSLRAYASGELAVAHAMARDTKSAEPIARRAIEIAQGATDEVRALVYETLGIVLTGALELEEAAEVYRESLRLGRRCGDAWLEGLALNRLPIVLAWQGRLDEARSYLVTAWEAADATGDWADYSLAIGTLTALALARGDFDEVESLARQAVSIARRSGYLWGGAMAISAVAPARALRGRLDEARDAAALLETPGTFAREIPPVWGAMAVVLRLRLSALVGESDAAAHEQAAGLAGALLATQTDPQVLPALCACVEIAALAGDKELAQRAGARVAEAARRGVVFTAALDEVLSRVLGLAAEVNGRPEEALAHFEAALEAAERAGARMLQARIHADLARVEEVSGDKLRARRNVERALALAERLGMEPLRAACARRLSLTEGAAGGRERPQPLGAEGRRLLRGIASGFDENALAGDLLLTREGLGRLRERVFAQIGASGNVEAAAFAHREGLVAAPQRGFDVMLGESVGRAPPVRRREPRPLTVFVSDIANSSELIQRLGDEAAQALIHEHNRVVRAGFRRRGGVELQHTGDGFIATFESPSEAVRCAVALQQEFERRRLGPDAAPLRVRVGLHAGEPLLEEGRLFGVVMHTAARICGACEGGEIRLSHEVWRSAGAGSEWPADDLGPVPLKGLFEPVSLHRVRWGPGESPAV